MLVAGCENLDLQLEKNNDEILYDFVCIVERGIWKPFIWMKMVFDLEDGKKISPFEKMDDKSTI